MSSGSHRPGEQVALAALGAERAQGVELLRRPRCPRRRPRGRSVELRLRIERTSARRVALPSRLMTNDRSILRMSIGNWRR